MEATVQSAMYEMKKMMSRDKSVDFPTIKQQLTTRLRQEFPHTHVSVILPIYDWEKQKEILYVALTSAVSANHNTISVFLGTPWGIFMSMNKMMPHGDRRMEDKVFLSMGSNVTVILTNPNEKEHYTIHTADHYDVEKLIRELHEIDDMTCSCCMVSVKESEKAVNMKKCANCSCIVCNRCFYDAKINKTNICFVCQKNYV